MAGEIKKNTYTTALQQIRKGKLAGLYFFYGDEMFLADKLKDAVILKALGSLKDDFNLHVFYGRDSRMEDVINAASGFPMMNDRKVVVIRDIDYFSKADKEALLQYVKIPVESTCLIMTSPKTDFRLAFYKTLDERCETVELRRPWENEWEDWIEQIISENGKSIEPNTAAMLASRVEVSLQELSSEIDKIVTYVGERPVITDEDVEAVIGLSRQYNSFELNNAVGEKNLAKALAIFRQMLTHGEEPIGMVVMLYRHFNILWMIKDLTLSGASQSEMEKTVYATWSLKPFFIRQSYLPQSRDFTLPHLMQAFSHLQQADIELKSGGLDSSIIMEKLIYQLIHNTPQ